MVFPIKMYKEIFLLERTGFLVQHYPCAVEYFWPYRDELRKHFRIKKSIQSQAKDIIEKVFSYKIITKFPSVITH